MLRDLIVKDFWVKLVSVLAAVVIWGTVKINISRKADPVAKADAQPNTQRPNAEKKSNP